MKDKNISRRRFLKLFGAGAATATVALTGCKSKAEEEIKDDYKKQVEPPTGKMT